ncbi:MAG TPA: type II CAAX endopeptidase family protein [Gemmatimonadaceae bacterium]|nr:type II CAAX endopeptidase family protein [Gemmatimonadaceae bacterium]
MGQARRGLAIYFAVLVPVSAILELVIVRANDNIGRYPWIIRQYPWVLILLLMWTPAISSIVARLSLREGFADVSFRLGGRQALPTYAAAVLMPLIVGTLAYGAAWATGLAGFKTPTHGGFFPYLGLALVYGATLEVVFGTGEEIGWRGYMLTRLIDAGVPQPLLVSGIIWALWHFPLILSGTYAAGPHPGISAGIFLVDVVGIGFVIGILRLRSGSVWPAALLHGEWNGIIQGPFDGSSTGPGATTWVGESGILVAGVSLAIGIAVAARYHKWHRETVSADVKV